MDAVDKKIPLVEMFGPTIQGEGSVLGQQTYFLRFGLCDYRCTLCDSLHAVLPAMVKKHSEWLTQPEIFDKFMQFYKADTTRWVSISGGNPAIHDLEWLVDALHTVGFRVNVETQGTLFPSWLLNVDHLTISPKGPGMGIETTTEDLNKFIKKVPDQTWFYGKASLKVVAFDQRDLEFAADVFQQGSLLGIDYENMYLSLGNPNPPGIDGDEEEGYDHTAHITALLKDYRLLAEDIMQHPILSKVKFLPQWHVFVYGNAKGH